MKAINYLNYFFISTPILLVTIGFTIGKSTGNCVAYGLLFLILTGLFQLIFGIKMLIDEPHDKNLQYYTRGVLFFFLLWFFDTVLVYYDFIYYLLYSMPLVLAAYFTFIVYQKANP